MLKIIHAVLFDFDGLLADTESLHVMAYKTVFERFGIELNEEELYRRMGVPTRENMKKIMADHGIPPERTEELIKLRYDSYYDLVKTIPLSFMDGTIECLEYIMKRELKRGLVTSSIRKHAFAVMENLREHSSWRMNFLDYFDVMVFGDEIERNKPNPEIYQKALERLDMKPEHCIAIEDSEVGVLAAKGAGLFVIAIPNINTAKHNFEKADMRLDSLREIAQKELFD